MGVFCLKKTKNRRNFGFLCKKKLLNDLSPGHAMHEIKGFFISFIMHPSWVQKTCAIVWKIGVFCRKKEKKSSKFCILMRKKSLISISPGHAIHQIKKNFISFLVHTSWVKKTYAIVWKAGWERRKMAKYP